MSNLCYLMKLLSPCVIFSPCVIYSLLTLTMHPINVTALHTKQNNSLSLSSLIGRTYTVPTQQASVAIVPFWHGWGFSTRTYSYIISPFAAFSGIPRVFCINRDYWCLLRSTDSGGTQILLPHYERTTKICGPMPLPNRICRHSKKY